MKISLQELYDMNACKEGIARFQLQTNGTQESVDVATLVGGHNIYSDLLWLANETFGKQRLVKLACDCALINIELIRPYTDSYDLIVNWLNNPDTNIVDAADAARAAAAYAADAADTYAYAAAYAADAYAYDAVYYAAQIDQAKVNALLVQLFNEVD